jgi:hypothetical protein
VFAPVVGVGVGLEVCVLKFGRMNAAVGLLEGTAVTIIWLIPAIQTLPFAPGITNRSPSANGSPFNWWATITSSRIAVVSGIVT